MNPLARQRELRTIESSSISGSGEDLLKLTQRDPSRISPNLVFVGEELADGLAKTLRQHFNVHFVTNRENVVEFVTLIQPDVIVLDMAMPDDAQWSKTYQRIRSAPACVEVPVLFLAASTDLAQRLYCLNLGAADYIPNPFSSEEVLVRAKFHCHLWLAKKRLYANNQALRAEIKQQERAQAELMSRMRTGIVVAVKRQLWEIHYCNCSARQLISNYYGLLVGKLLPEPLCESIKTATGRRWSQCSCGGGLLITYHAIEKRVLLLTFEEQPRTRTTSSAALCCLGLTPREAEVLFWIAEGKTSPEIAVIIGAAMTTIKKHVSHILEKLSVENRLSAALLANEILRSDQKTFSGEPNRVCVLPGKLPLARPAESEWPSCDPNDIVFEQIVPKAPRDPRVSCSPPRAAKVEDILLKFLETPDL